MPRTGDVLLDRYRLGHLLGEGGMGEVWAARDTGRGDLDVAIKLLKATDPVHRRRFLREARLAMRLSHPHLVRVFDTLELDGGRLGMVMERLYGESLRERLARDARLSVHDAAQVAIATADAMDLAHLSGIVHRDLKPENVFLVATAAAPLVKVLDFGIAKISAHVFDSALLTSTGVIMGTPHYMAPEQVFGERILDARADVWALGVILFECVSGARPFEGDNLGQVLKAITLGRAPRLRESAPHVPSELASLVDGMLARKPEDRVASMADVASELRRIVAAGSAPTPLVESVKQAALSTTETISSRVKIALRASVEGANADEAAGVPDAADTVPQLDGIALDAVESGPPARRTRTAVAAGLGLASIAAVVAALGVARSSAHVTSAPASTPTGAPVPAPTPEPVRQALAPEPASTAVAPIEPAAAVPPVRATRAPAVPAPGVEDLLHKGSAPRPKSTARADDVEVLHKR